MQTIETFKNQIHCKLTYKAQIRRFIFHGTEFAELRGHISNLLSLSIDGFVLKYVDNESDLITLTSNEDLSLALDISDKLLRLVVDSPLSASLTSPCFSTSSPKPPDSSQMPPPPSPDPSLSFSFRSGHGGRYRGHGHGNFHHYHHGGGGGGGGGGHGAQFQPEKAKFRIQSKIEFLKQQLEQNPQEDWKRQNLLMKIHRLEGRLLRWEGIQEKKMNKNKWKEEKKEQKSWKHEKKWEKITSSISRSPSRGPNPQSPNCIAKTGPLSIKINQKIQEKRIGIIPAEWPGR